MRSTLRTLSVLTSVASLAACTSAPVVTTSVPVAPPPVPVTPIDLTRPPALGAPPTLSVPPITTRELPNGLKIVVVEQHELPIADAILELRTGGESDPAGKMGTAALTSALLTA